MIWKFKCSVFCMASDARNRLRATCFLFLDVFTRKNYMLYWNEKIIWFRLRLYFEAVPRECWPALGWQHYSFIKKNWQCILKETHWIFWNIVGHVTNTCALFIAMHAVYDMNDVADKVSCDFFWQTYTVSFLLNE